MKNARRRDSIGARRSSRRGPGSAISWPMAGVRWATVTPSCRSQLANQPGVPTCSGSGTTMVAPSHSGQNMSRWIGS